MITCQQIDNGKQCTNPAACRFTWPGHDERVICEAHALRWAQVANAMGMYLQLIPLDAAEFRSTGRRRWSDGKEELG